jgi:hypothetical protein
VLGGADLERLHAERQRRAIRRLDEQVNMRALDAQLHDVKRVVLQHGDRRLANRCVGLARAQASACNLGDDAQRDVKRRVRGQLRSLRV